MVMGPEQAAHYNCFVVFLLLCSYYVTDMIKKNWNWYLLVVKVLFKTEFGHAQISLPKIGKPIPKTVYQSLKDYSI